VSALSRRRRNGQRGAVLVELTIVTPLLMIILLGLFEIGSAWRANQTVVQAARSGARTITQLGQFEGADQQGLLAIRATFGVDAGDITKVVIYKADSDGNMPADCATVVPPATAPVGVECNVYGPDDIADAETDTLFDTNGTDEGCSGTDPGDPVGRSAHWCPSDRNNVQVSADYVGVYVEFQEQWATGFFGPGTFTISETTVMRIEPNAD